MHILIIGAGGIGAFYGAQLLTGGHAVTFVARGPHLEALKSRGLRVNHPDFTFDGAVEALSLAALVRTRRPAQFGLVVVCVKSDATEFVGQQMAQWFQKTQESVAVLSLQNGVDNEQAFCRLLGGTGIFGGLVVRLGAQITKPGCIEAVGVGQVIAGRWPNEAENPSAANDGVLALFLDALRAVGLPAHKTEDIRRELWRKLLINNGVNPLSALTNLDTRHLTRDPGMARLVLELMKEAARAAAADDVILEQSDVEEMFEVIANFDAIKTSMLIDREHGKPLEIDSICGAVLERSARLELEAPYTFMAAALLAGLSQQGANGHPNA